MPTSILDLPEELAVQIFSHLEPEKLRNVMLVCKRWNSIINDEVVWREAFMRFWQQMPYRRLAQTWRGEYSLRVNLFRICKRGRCTAVTAQPRLGSVSKLLANFGQGQVFVASRQGSVTSCDIKTGRVARDIVNCSIDSMVDVTCLKFTPGRIYVGLSNGSIIQVANYRDGGSLVIRTQMNGRHSDQVRCIETITARNGSEAAVITASVGQMIIWDPQSFDMLASFDIGHRQVPLSMIVASEMGAVLVYFGQSIRVWRNVQFSDNSAFKQTEPVLFFDIDIPVLNKFCKTLLYDAVSSLVFVVVGESIHVHDAANEGRLVTTLISGHVESSDFTSICWDTDVINSSSSSDALPKNQNKRMCLLVAGDERGNVSTWNLHRLLEHPHNVPSKIVATRFSRLHNTGIISVTVDAFKVTSISSDHLVIIFCVLSGAVLKQITIKRTRQQREDGPFEASVVTSLDQVIVGYGEEVYMWNFDGDNQLRGHKNFAKRRIGNTRRNVRPVITSRSQLQFQSRQDVKESNKILAQERQEREQYNKQVKKHNINDMSEEEMVQYAMLLSREGNQRNPHSLAQSIPSTPMNIPSGPTSGSVLQMRDFLPPGSFESASPLSQSFEITSSYRNAWPGLSNYQGAIANDEQLRNRNDDDSDDDNAFPPLSSSAANGRRTSNAADTLNVFPENLQKRRSTSTQEWSSLKIIPHPDAEKAKQEDMDLQYVLELSLQEQ